MTKGWYGNRYGHSLASKGIKTKSDFNSSYTTYGEWMKGVDDVFWTYIGLGVHDMQDYMWRDLYDDTLTPREAFRSFIEDNLNDLGDAGWEIMSKMDEEDKSKSLKHIKKEFKQFRVGVVDENGKEYIEYFDDEKEAYERWLEYRSSGDETWYSKLISNDIGEYETVKMYDPDRDEDDYYWNTVNDVMKLLKKESIDPNYASPNFVKDFADNRGISLTSDEVVRISNNYDKHYEAYGEEKKSPTAKNINKTMDKIEKDAEETAVIVNKGIAKLKRLAKKVRKEAGEKFNKSAEDTAKTIKNIGKKIDDSAEDTAKDINKILKVKK